MAFLSSSSSSVSMLSFNIRYIHPTNTFQHMGIKFFLNLGSSELGYYSQHVPKIGTLFQRQQRFLGESIFLIVQPKVERFSSRKKDLCVSASWLANPQIASGVFTVGTAAVLPFYALMVLAPKADLTKRSMESNIPYILLGALYGFLLYLSWSPDTIRLMFASKYWLPELSSIAQMFKSEMTLASAWIHLLAVDLFAARQVFHDGQKDEIETRHSISLCLLFCPIGIMSHAITKAITKGKCRTK
ncbi:unnamed protein product [Victoria cruziana]